MRLILLIKVSGSDRFIFNVSPKAIVVFELLSVAESLTFSEINMSLLSGSQEDNKKITIIVGNEQVCFNLQKFNS